MERGPIGARFAANLRKVRKARGWDQARLSEELAKIEHPIGVNSISRMEKGERRADVSDLVALAVALDCAPGRLFLPEAEPDGPVALTATKVTTWRRAWQWAAGERSLEDPEQETFPRSWDNYLEAGRWVADNRPHDPALHVSGAQVLGAAEDLGDVVAAIEGAQKRGIPTPVIFAYLELMKTMAPGERGGAGNDGR